jgi:hypothetical protein
MAIRHNFTILCENVLRDVTGKLSLVSMFQDIEVPQFPGTIGRLYLVISLTGGLGERYRVAVEPPQGGEPLVQAEDQVDPPNRQRKPEEEGTNTNQLILEWRQAIFPAEGVYHVVVTAEGREIHRHPFAVLTPAAENATGNGNDN